MARSPVGRRGSPTARVTGSRRRSGRRCPPPCAGITSRRTQPSRRAATATLSAGRCARTPAPNSTPSRWSSAPMYQPIPAFVAATGLRPEEWAALERRDIDRRGRGTQRAAHDQRRRDRRPRQDERVPADRCRSPAAPSPRSTSSPPDSTRRACSPPPRGGLFDLDDFRKREWAPAIEASGVPPPRPDLRPAGAPSPPTRWPQA